ncbi:MAG: hypothetical protein M1840_007680 [Geoglossum simile]|nr:MAG: hypothetical protein M1840_007680 [Geoglossum simile]
MDSKSTTSSPKANKRAKTTNWSAVPIYGCDHLQRLLTQSQNTKAQTIKHYAMLLEVLSEKSKVIAQTYRKTDRGDGVSITSIRSTHLCLQCGVISNSKDSYGHSKFKQHIFAIDSHTGCIYCHLCRDFVYDTTLEELRLTKKPTSKAVTKRKLDEFQTSPEDAKYIDSNTSLAPCRATGLRGLYNMGQTCFMSVIIQSLIHNPIVRNFFLGDGHDSTKCDREICLSCAMDEVFTEFFAGDKTDGFGAVDILAKSWLTQQACYLLKFGNEMQDAHEYLHFVLGQLHASNGGGSDLGEEEMCECIIHKSFYGKLQSDVTCERCHNVTTAVDPVMELNLELQGRSNAMEAQVHGTIQDLHGCFDRFTSPEKLNNYNCERCSATDQGATKQLSLSRLPSVLCLQLKRFANVSSTSSKLDYKVQFPLQLDAFRYTARSKRSKAVGSEMYDLLGVIVHMGTIDTGHYISYAREGRQWFRFDDSKVTLASEQEVLSADAYLLFYIDIFLSCVSTWKMTACTRELSKSTLEALSQFYNERDDRQKQFEGLKAQAAEDADFSSISMELFAEDWNASQFWVCLCFCVVSLDNSDGIKPQYDDETASVLATYLLEDVKDNSAIAVISAPSVFVQIKKLLASKADSVRPQIFLFEFDRRFSVFKEFIYYDFENPTRLSRIKNPSAPVAKLLTGRPSGS